MHACFSNKKLGLINALYAAATRIRNLCSQRPASMVLRRATCVPSEAVFFHYSSRRSYMLNARVLFRWLEL